MRLLMTCAPAATLSLAKRADDKPALADGEHQEHHLPYSVSGGLLSFDFSLGCFLLSFLR